MSLFERAKKARENKKGFTLVELIVVLVILAILAAIMVPALTGWIDKAKEKQIVINARTAYLAAQTIASEEYADNTAATAPTTITDTTAVDNLADVDGSITGITVSNGKVTGMTYTESGKSITLSTDAAGKTSWGDVS